jgi:hypothetical protein
MLFARMDQGLLRTRKAAAVAVAAADIAAVEAVGSLQVQWPCDSLQPLPQPVALRGAACPVRVPVHWPPQWLC